RRGEKHPLGLREGATENAAACTALLTDLIERGLNPERAILVVIDGAKGAAQGGARGLWRASAAPPLARAQEAQRRRGSTATDARTGAQCDEPGLCDRRSQARPPPARESGPAAGVRPSRRRSFAGRRVG